MPAGHAGTAAENLSPFSERYADGIHFPHDRPTVVEGLRDGRIPAAPSGEDECRIPDDEVVFHQALAIPRMQPARVRTGDGYQVRRERPITIPVLDRAWVRDSSQGAGR